MIEDPEFWNLLALSLGLGLFGFIEPCTVGSSLLFVRYLEDRGQAEKVRATLVFTVTRALFIGALGAAAAVLGAVFFDLQRGFWMALGALYLALGAVYLLGRQGVLMRTLGPALSRAGETKGAAGLGILFGLNIPACAAPLLGALLTASLGAAGLARGFILLGVFGLARGRGAGPGLHPARRIRPRSLVAPGGGRLLGAGSPLVRPAERAEPEDALLDGGGVRGAGNLVDLLRSDGHGRLR